MFYDVIGLMLTVTLLINYHILTNTKNTSYKFNNTMELLSF